MAVTPYLNFSGNAREAYDFYCEAFDVPPGDRNHLMTFGQIPGGKIDSKDAELVENAWLPLPGGSEMMLSDTPSSMPDVRVGNNVTLVIDFADDAALHYSLGKLADGGNIGMPAGETFFAKDYAMVTDRFGVTWQLIHGIKADPTNPTTTKLHSN